MNECLILTSLLHEHMKLTKDIYPCQTKPQHNSIVCSNNQVVMVRSKLLTIVEFAP